MNDIKQEALVSLEAMGRLLLRKHLAEKVISQSVLEELLEPFEKMDWLEKKERAEALIAILQTSNYEEEILRCEELL